MDAHPLVSLKQVILVPEEVLLQEMSVSRPAEMAVTMVITNVMMETQ